MEEENTQGQNGQEPGQADEGSPVPDPEEQNGGDAEDVPEAD
jgi:hypothetical protein